VIKDPDQYKGMPVYADDQVREIVDSLESNGKNPGWYPANGPSRALWHCLESLRDIEQVVRDASSKKNGTKRKRYAKFLSIHLLSLTRSMDGLCNQIISDKDSHSQLKKNIPKEVSRIKRDLLELVPSENKEKLATIRNKLGAHIDKEMWPWNSEKLFKNDDIHEIGKWLHICIHAIVDLIKLEYYSWSLNSGRPNYTRIMSNEPCILTFHVHGEEKDLAAIHISKRSPKQTIIFVIESVLKNSDWLFKPEQRRILQLVSDSGKNWNTFKDAKIDWLENKPMPGWEIPV
jgi:hypothetical protein